MLQLSIQSTMVTATNYEPSYTNFDKQQSKESSKEESNSKVVSTIIHPTSSYIRYLELQLDDINTQLNDYTANKSQDDDDNNNRILRRSSQLDDDNDDYDEQLLVERDIIQHELKLAISKITNSGSAAYTTLMEFEPSLHDDTQPEDDHATNNSRHRVLKQRMQRKLVENNTNIKE